MKLLLKSAVIAFSAIGIVLSSHTISYAADNSTANIVNTLTSHLEILPQLTMIQHII